MNLRTWKLSVLDKQAGSTRYEEIQALNFEEAKQLAEFRYGGDIVYEEFRDERGRAKSWATPRYRIINIEALATEEAMGDVGESGEA